jgi:hypothetical protein
MILWKAWRSFKPNKGPDANSKASTRSLAGVDEMKWWWNVTVEWPATLGDWLLKVLVQWPTESLKRVTFRGVLVTVLITMLAALLIQAAVPVEMAFFAAGDFLTYFEIFTIIGLIASRESLRGIRIVIKRRAKDASQIFTRLCAFGKRKAFPRQPVSVSQRRRASVKRKPSNDDSDPFGWGVPA